MAKVTYKIFSSEGKEMEEIELPASVFDRALNKVLLAQAVSSMVRNMRPATSHAKDRSEVRGGGRKPWRQKGTGRARHGSIRSPIWKGGGAAHGPHKERVMGRKINKKMKDASLAMVLSGKRADGEIVIVEKMDIEKPQTKHMSSLFDNTIGKKRGSILVVLDGKNSKVEKSISNLSRVDITDAKSLSAHDALSHKHLLLTKDALNVLVSRLS